MKRKSEFEPAETAWPYEVVPTYRADQQRRAMIADTAKNLEDVRHKADVQHWPGQLDMAEVTWTLGAIAPASLAQKRFLGCAHSQVQNASIFRDVIFVSAWIVHLAYRHGSLRKRTKIGSAHVMGGICASARTIQTAVAFNLDCTLESIPSMTYHFIRPQHTELDAVDLANLSTGVNQSRLRHFGTSDSILRQMQAGSANKTGR